MEQFAVLLTCIKLQHGFKTFVNFEWPLKTGFTVFCSFELMINVRVNTISVMSGHFHGLNQYQA